MLQLLLLPVTLAMAIFLLAVAVSLNPWNLVLIYGFVWLCWPKTKRPRR